ncbi:MAG: amidase, partial [Alphaproteobacteria bacterium]
MTSNAPAMGWEEWMRHDATSLAGLVRSGQLQASEVVAQAARGVERVNGRLAGVLEVFQDVVEDPARARPARDGR